MQAESSPELGRYLVATRDIKAGEKVFTDAPLVVGPCPITPPVCLKCYAMVDGSYKYAVKFHFRESGSNVL